MMVCDASVEWMNEWINEVYFHLSYTTFINGKVNSQMI